MKEYQINYRTTERFYELDEQEKYLHDFQKYLNSPNHDVKQLFINNGYGIEITEARTVY